MRAEIFWVGLRELVERTCSCARRFAKGLRDAGFEVLNELRTQSEAREIPVVIHSSKDLTEEERHRLSLPRVTLLSKSETAGPDALASVSRALATVGFDLRMVEEHHA